MLVPEPLTPSPPSSKSTQYPTAARSPRPTARRLPDDMEKSPRTLAKQFPTHTDTSPTTHNFTVSPLHAHFTTPTPTITVATKDPPTTTTKDSPLQETTTGELVRGGHAGSSKSPTVRFNNPLETNPNPTLSSSSPWNDVIDSIFPARSPASPVRASPIKPAIRSAPSTPEKPAPVYRPFALTLATATPPSGLSSHPIATPTSSPAWLSPSPNAASNNSEPAPFTLRSFVVTAAQKWLLFVSLLVLAGLHFLLRAASLVVAGVCHGCAARIWVRVGLRLSLRPPVWCVPRHF
jgi:hypothetical protein